MMSHRCPVRTIVARMTAAVVGRGGHGSTAADRRGGEEGGTNGPRWNGSVVDAPGGWSTGMRSGEVAQVVEVGPNCALGIAREDPGWLSCWRARRRTEKRGSAMVCLLGVSAMGPSASGS